MNLFNNPEFSLGALMAFGALLAASILFISNVVSRRYFSQRMVSPVGLFLLPYLGFLCLSFVRPFFPVEFVPSVEPGFYESWTASLSTVSLYLLGSLAFFSAYVTFGATARRFGFVWRAYVGPLSSVLKVRLGSQKLHYFLLSVTILWGIGLAANVIILVQLPAPPLFAVSVRSNIDPRLAFLAEFQPLIVLIIPSVTYLRDTLPSTFKRIYRPSLVSAMVITSLSMLTLLGARNLPAKLGLALFLLWILRPYHRPGLLRKNARVALALGLLLFLLVGVAGALTKVEIYGLSPGSLPGAVLGAPMSDSVGNLYSFEAMISFAGSVGHFHGNLLWTTFLSYIPGRDELYANYVVGQLLGYRTDQLRSISSTFNGPAVLDFGTLGIIGNSYFYGLLLGYGWAGAKRSPRNLGALAIFLSTSILDIHLGTYNLWSFFAIAILVGTVEYNRVP